MFSRGIVRRMQNELNQTWSEWKRSHLDSLLVLNGSTSRRRRNESEQAQFYKEIKGKACSKISAVFDQTEKIFSMNLQIQIEKSLNKLKQALF
jgi:hypothetical protein